MHERYDGRWLAVRVRTNSEKAVLSGLRCKGYEDFVPTFQRIRWRYNRWEKLTLPLFAGYVFCRFDSRISSPIVTTPGVLHIVGNGKEPIPIDDEEILALQSVVASPDLPIHPWPRLATGQRVYMNSGPLKGVTGVLINVKNAATLIISVPLLQRSVAVQVSSSWISTLGGPQPGATSP